MAATPGSLRSRSESCWDGCGGGDLETVGLGRGIAVASHLQAHTQVARRLAVEHGVHVSARGRVSLATCEELAILLR